MYGENPSAFGGSSIDDVLVGDDGLARGARLWLPRGINNSLSHAKLVPSWYSMIDLDSFHYF